MANDPVLLARGINAFYRGRFVVGTQVFRDQEFGRWVALVYWKEKPE